MILFGSRMHVWGEGAEWWMEPKRRIFLFLLSATPVLPLPRRRRGICFNKHAPTSALSSPGITLRMCKCLSIFVGTKKLSKHNVSQDLRPAVINLWESRWFICFTRIHRLHHISHSLQNLNLLYEYFTIKASLLSVLLIVCLALIYGGCECVCLSDLFLQAS